MTIVEFEQVISHSENLTIEFKTWIYARDMRERISLAVDELVAFANAKGGTVYMGVEDDGDVTGCIGYDVQKIIESIYDRTHPALFTDIEVIKYKVKDVLAIKVERDGTTYAVSDVRCLKRLGRNSKPYYSDEVSNKYSSIQSPDFSGQILADSTVEDINALEIYNLKEKLKIRVPKSSLPELEDMSFSRDLGLIKEDEGVDRLTIAGLLFVGKGMVINRLLPQAEVIQLHYLVDNMEEYDSRLDLKQPIISVIGRLTEKIQNTNKIVNVQVGPFRLEVEDFSEKGNKKNGDKKVTKKTQMQYDKILAFMEEGKEYGIWDFCELLDLKESCTKVILQGLSDYIEVVGSNRDRRYKKRRISQ